MSQLFRKCGYYDKMFLQADSKRRAYENVNPNLGFMMRALLEGSDAKLVPVHPNNIQDGVRVSRKITTSTQTVNFANAVYLQ